MTTTTAAPHTVIVGFGMVGHRTATELLDRDPNARITVISGGATPTTASPSPVTFPPARSARDVGSAGAR
ncbi:hypothetical protein [Corynebacterium variabile]